MSFLRFSRVQLSNKLEQLPLPLGLIFAASCAERLLPAYITFSELAEHGEPETLMSILARLWRNIGGERMTESEVQASLDSCTELIPSDDNESLDVEPAYAENASAALAYALTSLQKCDSREAMWSAEQAYEALDHFVVNRDNVNLNALGAEGRILADPLIQAELARQLRDIDELLGAADEDVKQVAARFRDRAKAEGMIFFGTPS